MATTTSTVSHDLTTWTVEELQLRYDALTGYPLENDRIASRLLCHCSGPEPCEVDSTTAIDRELAVR